VVLEWHGGLCYLAEITLGGRTLANHKSAAKRARQTIRRTGRNSQIKKAVRTCEKKLRLAVSNKKGKEALELLVKYDSKISKAAQKGIIHAKNASRRVGRLASQVQAIGGKK